MELARGRGELEQEEREEEELEERVEGSATLCSRWGGWQTASPTHYLVVSLWLRRGPRVFACVLRTGDGAANNTAVV